MSKTRKTAVNRQISPVGDFKQRLGGIVELPSGFTVKVKNPGGLRVFMDSGTIPNSLMGIIEQSLDKGRRIKDSDVMKDGQIDPQMLNDMMAMLDTVAVKTIVEPAVLPAPTDEDVKAWNEANPTDQVDGVDQLRDDDQLYADEIPQDDKMFLFQWISGGTRDLERFRREYDASMESMAAVEGNGDSAE